MKLDYKKMPKAKRVVDASLCGGYIVYAHHVGCPVKEYWAVAEVDGDGYWVADVRNFLGSKDEAEAIAKGLI